MRRFLLVCVLLAPASAWADCPEHAGQSSTDRTLSDAPYAAPTTTSPCKAPSDPPGLAPNQGWTAERDDTRMQFARVGTFLVTLGGVAMATAGAFAICSNNDVDPKGRKFCHDATIPTLIGGVASAGLGLGALGFSTFVLREENHRGQASIAAGLNLRLAFDFGR